MAPIDREFITRELPQLIGRGVSHMSVISKREVDHRAIETFLVAFTCIFGVGGWIFWMIRQK
ncbi:uncharacterized protein GGS22DRAFT_189405 [Annulohypoxylon maeteangense]|uniref:uncharacterized protein n=1 Tax=Annulohypoxylon maeteangense TaxID=1927788 RepID=UPI002008484A|nr:uncharacterized protein GGS22DRAFT_189405 [Annulohypoxylon maeteangense]KAI0884276.1 hypothetical protein GGS22DRAFT_189405 [Annulohypoxylon maeteangense]